MSSEDFDNKPFKLLTVRVAFRPSSLAIGEDNTTRQFGLFSLIKRI